MQTIIVLLSIAAVAGWSVVIYGIVRRARTEHIGPAAPLETMPGSPSELAGLAIQLSDQIEVQKVLRTAGEWLRRAGDFSLVVFYVYDAAAHELTAPVVVGRELAALPSKLRLSSNAYGGVLNTRQAQVATWPMRHPNFGPTCEDIQSAYMVPLVHSNNPLGVMSLQSVQADAFPEALRESLDRAAQLISGHLALTLRIADSQQAISRFDSFQTLAQRLTTRLDTKALLSDITAAACEMLDTPMSVLLEVEEPGDALKPVAWSGISAETALALRTQGREDLKGLVAWARKPARTSDLRTDQRTTHAGQAVVAGMIAELAVPVLYQDKLYGVLAVETNTARRFSDDEMNLLSSLAAQAGITLHNAELFSDLLIARDLALDANRAKSAFLANMSHELRTPLNAIIGYSELLEEESADTGQEDFIPDLKKIQTSGKHLLSLINDVLDLSKIEAGKTELHIEEMDILELLYGVQEGIKPLVEKNGNVLETDFESSLGTMPTDVTKLRQILLNLLSNAAKFTEQGTIRLSARHASIDDTPWLVIEVSDTGIGLSQEQMDKLFQPFTQADASTTRKYGGTGLGLAISRQFCQMLGGDISVESKLGEGTTFSVRVPLNAASQPTAKAHTDRKIIVLVVDDDDSIRQDIARYLSKDGFRVETAENAQQALQRVRDLHPDLITLDIMMAGADSWSILNTLKADPSSAQIPIIANSMAADKSAGFLLGAVEYLTKPINRERLKQVARGYRSDHEPRQALIVDDDPVVREMLSVTLKKEGWQSLEAEHGKAALAQLADNTPDLILLDVMMPEMDGFEFMAEFRKHEAWQNIPVIIVTALDLSAEEQQRLSLRMEQQLRQEGHNRDQTFAEIRQMINTLIPPADKKE